MTDRLNNVPGPQAAQTARASAVLPNAGAYDSAPTEMDVRGFHYVMLFLTYTRGGSGGDVQLKLEASPVGSGDSWFQVAQSTKGTVTSGSDALENIQRGEVEYGSTGATAEKVTYGPIFLGGCVERLRVPAQESGATGTPGTLAILARFS